MVAQRIFLDLRRLWRSYEHDSERLFSEDVFDADLPDIEFAGAFLLGLDLRKIAKPQDLQLIGRFFSKVENPLEAVPSLASVTIAEMNWNDAAEDLLAQVLAQTPRPVRDATEAQLREAAERLAEDDGKSRVGVETVIAAWIAQTPETIRPDLPRQMERFGLDPSEYEHLL
jgi:hypothetical protein